MRSLFIKFILWYRSKWRRFPKTPPYKHICQVGDPILRAKAMPVDEESIKDGKIQNIISTMVSILQRNEYMGLAAPQIGISLQIIIMEMPLQIINQWPKEFIHNCEIEHFPLKVFINPVMRIINPRKIIFPEGCASLMGFEGDVSRYYEVEISGYNEKGFKITWQAKGWSARIIQHEMDHLQGKLYIDRMIPQTFQNKIWYQINIRGKNKLASP